MEPDRVDDGVIGKQLGHGVASVDRVVGDMIFINGNNLRNVVLVFAHDGDTRVEHESYISTNVMYTRGRRYLPVNSRPLCTLHQPGHEPSHQASG